MGQSKDANGATGRLEQLVPPAPDLSGVSTIHFKRPAASLSVCTLESRASGWCRSHLGVPKLSPYLFI
jgi:hypothetical protein